jgi:hypothetical protein
LESLARAGIFSRLECSAIALGSRKRWSGKPSLPQAAKSVTAVTSLTMLKAVAVAAGMYAARNQIKFLSCKRKRGRNFSAMSFFKYKHARCGKLSCPKKRYGIRRAGHHKISAYRSGCPHSDSLPRAPQGDETPALPRSGVFAFAIRGRSVQKNPARKMVTARGRQTPRSKLGAPSGSCDVRRHVGGSDLRDINPE